MKKKSQWILLFVVLSLAISGCQKEQQVRQPKPSKLTDQMMVNVYYLSGKLGMEISSAGDDKIIFNDSLNTVTIIPKQNLVLINENVSLPLGKTKTADGMMYVRLSLVDEIKAKLNKPVEKPMVKPVPLPPPEKPIIMPPPEPQKPQPTGKTIVIDAGHGGQDPGATSYYGFYEKTVNLAVAAEIAQYLRDEGHKVIMTRSTDVFIELEQRAEIANRAGADVFISIHADAAARSSANGFSVYVARSASSEAERLARAIDDRMTRTSMTSNGVKEADFKVLVKTRCPAVLIELGYLSNYWEAKKLKNADMQRKLAKAIADGICNYLAKY